MPKRHILSILDLEPAQVLYIVNRALEITRSQDEKRKPLEGKVVGVYFRKTSTRTRSSFMVGAAKLGAIVVAYGPHDLQTNTGESIQDTARVLANYLDVLVIRTAESLSEMKIIANQDHMSVINAMSDNEHPTQALADLMTIKEHFCRLDDINVLYLGEGNNTAAALALAISRIQGMRLTMLTPEGYGLAHDVLDLSHEFARKYNTVFEEHHSVEKLPKNVDVVYTTRWQTTGTSKKDPNWRERFKPFSVTKALMASVSKPSGTVFMHDLPAVREEDVSSDVLDGVQSIAFRQARNKLYSAMAALEWCVLGSRDTKIRIK